MTARRLVLGTSIASLILTGTLLAALLATTGGTFALPLDDPYIYFQYAKQAARGEVFRYNDGDPATTGATSLLYLLVLTPLAVFLRGTALAVGSFLLGGALLIPTTILTARLARAWIGDWAAPLAALLLLLSGPFVWGVFSGMETALVGLLVVWFLHAIGTHQRETSPRATPVAVAGSLLCLARPEASVLVVGTFAACAAVARHPLPFGRVGTLVPLAAAAIPFALNLLLTGTPTSMTLASKGALYLPGTTPVTWAVKTTQFFMHNLKGLLGAGEAGTEAWPSAYSSLVAFSAPLTLPLLVLGAFPSLVDELRERRPGPVLAACILLFGSLALWAALVPINLHWSRYATPFLPIVVLFMVAGVARASRAFGESARSVRLGLSAFLALGSVPTLVFFVAMFAWNGREIAAQHLSMAEWVRESTPEGSWVGTNDVGAIAYYGERPVLDLHGLVTRELAEAKQVGPSAILEHLERLPARRRPATLIVIPSWFDESFVRFHRPVRVQTLHMPSIAGSPLVAYQANWGHVGAAERPGRATLAALGNRRMSDRLDVADLESERAHGYVLDLLPGVSAGPIGILVPPGDDAPVPDGGRLVTGSASFELRVAPGRDAVLVVRAMGALTAKVATDGHEPHEVVARPVAEDRWTEHAIPIPASHISDTSIHVVVEASRGAHQEGGHVSAHWWVFQ